jgi:hypothetical protein
MRKQGDGVLVYFGYPRAHEDDAERAVRAGLRLIDAVGRLDIKSAKLQARVGIATGLMVVGDLIGEGSAQDQSVVGETPNLAAWPPPRDRAGDIDPNYRRSPKLARQNFRRSNRARQVCKDSPLEGDGFEPSVPRRGQHFSRPPVGAFGARPSAREEIGPAEEERPFRGAPHRFCAPSTGSEPPGLPSSGEAMPRQEGGHEHCVLLRFSR